MSKAKNVSLCLPVMVVMGGKSYPAGTPVPMDAATAKEMRARYREVPESRAEKQPKRPVKPTGEALTGGGAPAALACARESSRYRSVERSWLGLGFGFGLGWWWWWWW